MATFKGTPRHTDKSQVVQDPRSLRAARFRSAQEGSEEQSSSQPHASTKHAAPAQEKSAVQKLAQTIMGIDIQSTQKKNSDNKPVPGSRRKSGTTKIAQHKTTARRIRTATEAVVSVKPKRGADTTTSSDAAVTVSAAAAKNAGSSVASIKKGTGQAGQKQRKQKSKEVNQIKQSFIAAFAKVQPFVGGILHFFKRYGRVTLLVLSVFVLLLASTYFPAKHFYIAKRTQERLQQEYELNIAHNAQLREDLENLQTPEGVEDEARKHMGLVREGEHAVSVVGISAQPSPDDPQHLKRVEKGSGVAEKHWWTSLLDTFFGLEDTSVDPRYQKAQEEKG